MSRWDRFKEGFVSVWRLLYPPGQDMDWYAQVGRITGAIAIVVLWKAVADVIIWMVT
jgi:hypothetical protein